MLVFRCSRPYRRGQLVQKHSNYMLNHRESVKSGMQTIKREPFIFTVKVASFEAYWFQQKGTTFTWIAKVLLLHFAKVELFQVLQPHVCKSMQPHPQQSVAEQTNWVFDAAPSLHPISPSNSQQPWGTTQQPVRAYTFFSTDWRLAGGCQPVSRRVQLRP